MNQIEHLKTLVAGFDLNRHPFYVEWRAGTLPRARLAAYAAEFEPFIAAIAEGWEAAQFPTYAAVEREHLLLWRKFRAAVGRSEHASLSSSETMVRVARRLFSTTAEALGALYAFETQQPRTARSKLDGLREHYRLGVEAEEYFRVHADDDNEAKVLEASLDSLPGCAFERARLACALLAAVMWSALDGLYYTDARGAVVSPAPTEWPTAP